MSEHVEETAGAGAGPHWERLSTRPGPSGWITIETATFAMPDGSHSDWDLITGPDIVAVVALTYEGEVVLVRQFRPGPARALDELPGGIIDPGESPLEAGSRELLEETGYTGDLTLVGSTWRGSNDCRRQWLVVGTGCRRVADPSPGEDEFVEVLTRPIADFRAQLLGGQMTDMGAGYRGLEVLAQLGKI
jgi:ADP-ribose pyrophosphatase